MARNEEDSIGQPLELASVRELVLGAVFIALGVAVPILFHMVGMGKVFLPMHLPVLIAGLVLRPRMAMLVGFLTPLASILLTGMPPAPYVLPMILELTVLAGSASILTTFRAPELIALPAAVACRCAVTWMVAIFLAGMFGLPKNLSGLASIVQGAPGIALQIVVAYLTLRIPILKTFRAENRG